MKTMRMIPMITAVLVLTACSSVPSGIVIDKEYEPEYTVFQPLCAGYNTSGQCTAWMQTPIHVDEKWNLTFEGVENSNNGEEKRKKRTVEVSQSVYDMVELGDEVSIDDKDYITINNERVPLSNENE